MLLAVADFIFVYSAPDGKILKKIKHHKDSIYALAFSKDGQRFASGSKDKSVVIWTCDGEGICKYTHTDPIQALAFNPVLQTLASVSTTDFGIWMTQGDKVNKTKIPARGCSVDWAPDGQLLAIGLFNGQVLVRDKLGAEVFLINKSTQPAWTLQFCP